MYYSVTLYGAEKPLFVSPSIPKKEFAKELRRIKDVYKDRNNEITTLEVTMSEGRGQSDAIAHFEAGEISKWRKKNFSSCSYTVIDFMNMLAFHFERYPNEDVIINKHEITETQVISLGLKKKGGENR